jgi:hypothetical protein
MGHLKEYAPGVIPVTVITPTIPTRGELLGRAIESVMAQTVKPVAHVVLPDIYRRGAASMLDQCLRTAQSEWVAVLADDDEFLPHHLETLWNLLDETGADVAYSHFKYSHLQDAAHLERFRGQPFDYENPRQMTGVYMGRRQLLLDIGGHQSLSFDADSYERDEQGNRIGEDYYLAKRLAHEKIPVAVTGEVTWIYHTGHKQTLGMPSAW